MRLRWDGNADRLGALFAAAVVAWATVGIALLVTALWIWPGSPIYMGGPIGLMAGILFPGFFIAAIVTMIVGWPALLVAERTQLTRWWHAAAFGAVGGALASLVVAAPYLSAQNVAGAAIAFIVCVIAGLLAGLAAWKARWRKLGVE